MQIVQDVRCLLDQLSSGLGGITAYSFNTSIVSQDGSYYPLGNDYCFWIYNGLIEDYQAITFLISNLKNIYMTSLRPIYAILRCSIEKYADILNFLIYKNRYYSYINYLNFKSIGDKAKSNECRMRAKKELGLEKCNRKTRYFLLGQVNNMLDEKHARISEFNRNLSKIDLYYSRLLHNNIDPEIVPNDKRINEILKYLQYMLYATTVVVNNYYVNQLDSGMVVGILHNIDVLLEYLECNIYM